MRDWRRGTATPWDRSHRSRALLSTRECEQNGALKKHALVLKMVVKRLMLHGNNLLVVIAAFVHRTKARVHLLIYQQQPLERYQIRGLPTLCPYTLTLPGSP